MLSLREINCTFCSKSCIFPFEKITSSKNVMRLVDTNCCVSIKVQIESRFINLSRNDVLQGHKDILTYYVLVKNLALGTKTISTEAFIESHSHCTYIGWYCVRNFSRLDIWSWASFAAYQNVTKVNVHLRYSYTVIILLLSPTNVIGQFEKYTKVIGRKMWLEFKIMKSKNV